MKRKHALVGVAIALAILLAFLLGAFAGYHYPYKTLPAPNQPGMTQPACHARLHTMGECQPEPKIELSASISTTTQGPDFSNNDPVYGAAQWKAIAAKNSFAYLKVSEGTGYIDPTAARMAALAKAVGLPVGGYDFLHVCLTNPVSEADVFSRALRADHLLGTLTLPPVADAEYGGSGCNARAWLTAWRTEVQKQTGRVTMIYTGAWWWQPHLGAWWPADALAWISGYSVRYPYMPAGRSQLDIWQFTDHGWNGATSADLNVWRDGAPAFAKAAQVPAPVRPHCYGSKRQHTAHCHLIRSLVAHWEREIVVVRVALAAKGCWVHQHRVGCPSLRAKGDLLHKDIHANRY